MTSQLTLRMQSQPGFDCERFENFPALKSAHIAICYTDNAASKKLAVELKNELISALTKIEGAFKKIAPCGGAFRFLANCGALTIDTNQKLLIVVSDGNVNTFADMDVLKWKTSGFASTSRWKTCPNTSATPSV